MTRNRRADWRRIKGHLNYTVDEAARTLNVHRGTVRYWIKTQGLPVLAVRRPHLIVGRDLVAFLKAMRESRKKRCGPGELYCLKCKAPRRPIAGFLEYRRAPASRGILVGLCEQCESVMRQFVSDKRAPSIAAEFGVQREPHHETLGDSAIPALNCYFGNAGQS